MPWELELWIVTEVEGSNFTCSTPLPSASPVPAHLTGARQQPVEPAVKGQHSLWKIIGSKLGAA